MNAIEIQDLVKVYKNGTHALKGVDLEVKQGDFFALLGANGAGKTTIIGILTSVVNKTAGKVKIFGLDIDKELAKAKKMIGVVPQEFNFSIFEKVLDIVVCQAGYFGVPRKDALKEAEKVLRTLELWDKRNKAARTLSGGMKRRLMIARALVHKPKLLILDEPTAGVDVELRRGMWKYLKKLNEEGTTILLTTHYLEEVEQLCRNVAIIKEGQIVKKDTVKHVLATVEKETYVVEIPNFKNQEKVKHFALIKIDSETVEVDLCKEDSLTDFVDAATKSGLTIKSIRPKENRLEQLFLTILQK